MELTFQPVQDLLALIRSQEVRADTDPAKVTTPGAWVTVETIRHQSLGRVVVLDAVVYLIASDRDHRRAQESLAALHNAIIPAVLVPDGPVVPQGVILPDNPTHPLPALRVPVTLTEGN